MGDDSWRLINLREDPIESKDLSALQPERFQELLAELEAYQQRVGVLELEPGYDPLRQMLIDNWPVLARQLSFVLLPVGLIVLGVPLLRLWWWPCDVGTAPASVMPPERHPFLDKRPSGP